MKLVGFRNMALWKVILAFWKKILLKFGLLLPNCRKWIASPIPSTTPPIPPWQRHYIPTSTSAFQPLCNLSKKIAIKDEREIVTLETWYNGSSVFWLFFMVLDWDHYKCWCRQFSNMAKIYSCNYNMEISLIKFGYHNKHHVEI